MSDELDALLDASSALAEADADEADAMARFVDGIAEGIEAEVEARMAVDPPGPPPPMFDARGPTRVRWLLVAAAAVVLVVGGWGLLRANVVTATAPGVHEAAEHVHEARDRSGVAEQREESVTPRDVAPPPVVAAPEELAVEEVAVEDASIEDASIEDASIEDARPRDRDRRRVPAAALRERLAALDAEAQAAWRTGDLAGAEETYRILIREAGRRPETHRAYAELFSLVRQQRGEAARDEVWREYLRRFPRGRYADDARAGLCRRSDATHRERCWRAYLQAFPFGAHREHAERELQAGAR